MVGGYAEWQSMLAEAFLSPRNGPNVLFLDDRELARLFPEVEDTGRQLAEAVRSRLRLTEGRSMFGSIIADFRRWTRGAQADPPPVLPVIAVTVLAATRMQSDAKTRSTNYYLRLAQVLLPDAEPDTRELLRNSLRERGAFLDVVEMWRGLHAWIEDQGGVVGVSTIREQSHLSRIGYPLSQALVRQSDRIVLTRFFGALGFFPGPVPEEGVLLSAIEIWTASGQNHLSDAFMHALGDAEMRPLLGSVVAAHAHAWGGLVLTRDGKNQISMRLSIDLDSWSASWLFPIPENGPENVALVGEERGSEIVLSASGVQEYYAVQGLPAVSPDSLRTGLRLSGIEYTAEFPGSPAIFLGLDPYTGSWSSVAQMLPFEVYLVAISASVAVEFKQVLLAAAVEGWRLLPQRGSVLLPGYDFFEGVRFARSQDFDLVMEKVPGLRRMGVTPAVVPRARLVRGLPIAKSISSTHYLVGGEPDLLLPTGPEPRATTVTLDGRSEQFRANGFPIELRRFGKGLGRHTVDVDGQQLSFTTLEENPDDSDPEGTGVIGWTSDGRMSGSEGELAVVGADVVETGRGTPVFARRGWDESWILHDEGRTEIVSEPPRPRFLSTIDTEIYTPRFELSAPASARWLAQRRGGRWRLTEIGSTTPRGYDLDIDVLSAWKRACGDAKCEQLWAVQLRLSAGRS